MLDYTASQKLKWPHTSFHCSDGNVSFSTESNCFDIINQFSYYFI